MANSLSSDKRFTASKKADDEKSVWFYFLRDSTGQIAKCQKCDKELKTAGGSTKGLHVHLHTKHDIDLLKRKPATDAESGESSASLKNSSSSSSAPCDDQINPTTNKRCRVKISGYFVPQNDKSLGATLARMIALDGLSFNIFCTSQDLRDAVRASGHHNLPTSPTGIQMLVMRYASSLRAQVTAEIKEERKAGQKFSLTFDEWSSLRNRRYMNINVHTKEGKFWSLGLTRVEGTMPAKKCIELVSKRLQMHGLRIESDVVCITTDGASVMTKVGKDLSRYSIAQQLCIAHGLQLAVLDVLYKKQAELHFPESNGEAETDSCIFESAATDGISITESEMVTSATHCLTKKQTLKMKCCKLCLAAETRNLHSTQTTLI